MAIADVEGDVVVVWNFPAVLGDGELVCVSGALHRRPPPQAFCHQRRTSARHRASTLSHLSDTAHGTLREYWQAGQRGGAPCAPPPSRWAVSRGAHWGARPRVSAGADRQPAPPLGTGR